MSSSKNISWRKLVLHLAAWAIVLSLPLLTRYDSGRPKHPDDHSFLLLHILTSVLFIPVFYFNTSVLTPRLLYTRKYFTYAGAVLGLYAVFILFHGGLFTLIVH